MECSIYQNYGAAEVMVQGLAGMVDQTDVEAIVRAQKKMLQRFEKTNEMLANCNNLSGARLERASRDFKGHTQHVTQLKKDLDSVFKRIRALKVKVASQHPEAYAHVVSGLDSDLVDGGEEDDEYDVAIKERRRSKAAAEQGAVKEATDEEASSQSPDKSSSTLKMGRISPIAEAGVDS